MFCHPTLAVLDCANGCQKENQDEVNQIEEECRQEVASEAASATAKNGHENGEEESLAKESRNSEEGVAKNSCQAGKENAPRRTPERKPTTRSVALLPGDFGIGIGRSAGPIEHRRRR